MEANPENSTHGGSGSPTSGLVRLTDILDAEEAAFVEKVMINSGGKMCDEAWSDDGERALWKRPEELKLISPVGSYKWIPTTRIVLCVEANDLS